MIFFSHNPFLFWMYVHTYMKRGPVFLNFNHTHHQIAISRCMIKIKISWINSSSGGPRCICHFWVSKLSPFHHFIKTRFSKVLLGDPISKTVIQKMKKLEMVPLLFFHNLKSSKSQEYLIFFWNAQKVIFAFCLFKKDSSNCFFFQF